MAYKVLTIAALSIALAQGCEEQKIRDLESRPSDDHIDVPGYLDEETSSASVGVPFTISISTTSLSIRKDGIIQDAEVRLRTLATVPDRRELVELGDAKSDIVEIKFYEKDTEAVLDTAIFSFPYRVSQEVDDVGNDDNLYYVVVSEPGSTNESIQLLDRTSIGIEGLSLTGSNHTATLLLKVSHAIVYAVEVDSRPTKVSIAPAGSVVSSASTESATSSGNDGAPILDLSHFEAGWTEGSNVGAPTPRHGHSAVWTGSKMIVWGGWDMQISEPLKTGGIYDPASDSWTEINTNGAPSARTQHSAVWTGTKMLIFGGTINSGDALSDCYEFDPENNRWDEIDTSEYAPAKRFQHTATWTGTEMIIWGGLGGPASELRSGSSYNPSTKTWTSMDIPGSPLGRYKHTATWTGDVMIVYGGSAIGSEVPSLGKYRPSNNTWLTINDIGIADRATHSAVWTGERLLITGGNGVFETNERKMTYSYDPSLDTVAAVSLDPNVIDRSLAVSAWTGSKMIIWGGSPQGIASNNGRIYDPKTDEWSMIPEQGPGLDTRMPTGLWAQEVLLVFGG